MTSQRWSALVSGLVLTLALAAGSPARAQFGFQGIPGSPSAGRFGLGYETGTAYGTWPYSYGSLEGAGFTGFGGIGTVPALPGYRLSSGQRPQAITSYQSVSSAVTLVPGWNGSSHRVRRRH
jgi:hypothetical protein